MYISTFRKTHDVKKSGQQEYLAEVTDASATDGIIKTLIQAQISRLSRSILTNWTINLRNNDRSRHHAENYRNREPGGYCEAGWDDILVHLWISRRRLHTFTPATQERGPHASSWARGDAGLFRGFMIICLRMSAAAIASSSPILGLIGQSKASLTGHTRRAISRECRRWIASRAGHLPRPRRPTAPFQ